MSYHQFNKQYRDTYIDFHQDYAAQLQALYHDHSYFMSQQHAEALELTQTAAPQPQEPEKQAEAA